MTLAVTYITSRDLPESPVTNQSDCLLTVARADAAKRFSRCVSFCGQRTVLVLALLSLQGVTFALTLL